MISERMRRKMSFAGAWEGEFGTLEYQAVMEKDIGTEIVCDFEDGDTQSMSGAEWYKVIYESNSGWALSSNGTIFRHDIKAVVPGLLERWYAERKVMQGKLRESKTDSERVFGIKDNLLRKLI